MAKINDFKNKFLKKIGAAFKGIYVSVKEESSVRWQILFSIIALILAIFFHKEINTVEWAIFCLLLVINIVFEIFNSAVENLVDMISFKYNINAKKIKDLVAGGCLIMSLATLAGCLVILIPAIIAYFS